MTTGINYTPTAAASVASRTVLGSLTTAFVAPTSCTMAMYYSGELDQGVSLSQSCSYDSTQESGAAIIYDGTGAVIDDTACWPPMTTGLWSTVPYEISGIYSPGVVCPVGQSKACFATAAVDGTITFQNSLQQSETAAGCCPTGYVCSSLEVDSTIVEQFCVTEMTIGSLLTGTCDGQITPVTGSLTLPLVQAVTNSDSTSTEISTTTISALSILAPMIQIVWQSTDTTTSAAASITEPGPASATPSSSSHPLSTGAAAGIGVSVAVVFMLAISGIAWYRIRRRRRRSGSVNAVTASMDGGDDGYAKPELDSNVDQKPHELHGQSGLRALELDAGAIEPRHELHDQARPHEMAAFGVFHELE